MRNTLKIASRLLLAVIVAGAAACGDGSDGTTGPSTPPPGGGSSSEASGSYALAQVRTLGHLSGGGSGLPVTFIDGSGDHLVFLSGTLAMGADGSFDMKVQVTFKGNASELTDHGTYSVSGGNIVYASQKSTPRLSTGTLNGNQITAKSQFGGIEFEIDVVR
jgi:hypothetical protein